MYALAAGVAGVSVFALTQPADAKIIYTKANVVIGSNEHYRLDLNHDGIKDFTIQNSYSRQGTCTSHNQFSEMPRTGNDVEGTPPWAKELSLGSPIGHSQSFEGARAGLCGWIAFRRNGNCGRFALGPWCNGAARYLGVAFQIHGKTHYGWARLSVSRSKTMLTGYAYETIPGKLIKAGRTHGRADDPTNKNSGPGASLINSIPDIPEPATLGLLAMGAHGLSSWRRESAGSLP
jgi:hypothetical protein